MNSDMKKWWKEKSDVPALILIIGCFIGVSVIYGYKDAGGFKSDALMTVLINGAFAMVPAIIAKIKGQRIDIWWVYGYFIFFIALIHSLAVSRKVILYKECPYCSENVKTEAKFCGSCGKPVEDIL